MDRLLAMLVFVYAGLSGAQFAQMIRLYEAPPTTIWCGNVVSDPYMFLVNVLGPFAAIATVALLGRCARSQRWPAYALAASFAFVAASGWLAYEGHILTNWYHLPLGKIWWLTWLGRY